MQHFNMSSSFVYSEDPFPAFRVSYVFGRRQRGYLLLPSKVQPLSQEGGNPTLPADAFKVIRTKEKGTVMIVPGADTTPRALLFCSVGSGYRGGVKLLSTKQGEGRDILAQCEASNACDGYLAMACILSPGKRIAFQSYGRAQDVVVLFRWDGQTMAKQVMPTEDWNAMVDAEVAATSEGAAL